MFVTLDQGHVADLDALDVRDRVERAGREDARLDAEVARPRARRVRGPAVRGDHDHDSQQEGCDAPSVMVSLPHDQSPSLCEKIRVR